MTGRISSDEYAELLLDNDASRPSLLARALEIRKFEIDLYWRRAAYFWTLIGASLVAFGAAQSLLPRPVGRELAIVAACLGLVFSFAWYCALRGSKKWQENWENHVDLIEAREEQPLYSVILSRTPPEGGWEHVVRALSGPGAFSVSKVNQVVSVFVCLLFMLLGARALGPLSLDRRIDWWSVAYVALAVLACSGIAYFGRTRTGDQRFIATRRRSTIQDSMPS